MTDAEYEGIHERIKALIERWTNQLGLRWWRVTYEYERESAHFKVDDEPTPATAACCYADWRYMEATVSFNMPVLVGMDDERLEYVFVHELMHIFLREMRSDEGTGKIDHEERVATTLAQAFVWMREQT